MGSKPIRGTRKQQKPLLRLPQGFLYFGESGMTRPEFSGQEPDEREKYAEAVFQKIGMRPEGLENH